MTVSARLTASVLLTAILSIAHVFFLSAAAAETYPAKPIRLVVSFTPGGGADISARIIGQKAGELLGQPIVIDNRAGAGGNRAAEFVAKSAPDGYTLLQTTVAHAISRSLYKSLTYDYVKDFVAVAPLGSTPFVLAVNSKIPARTVAEFIAYAKAQPRRLDYSSSGNGGPSHLAAELFMSMTGVKMQHIPYKGVGPAVTDLMAGQVQATFVALPTMLGLIQSGNLTPLGLSSLQRSELAPELPTIAEQGLPGFEAITWYGALAPAGTPPEIIDKLEAAFAKVLQMPDVRVALHKQGFDLHHSTRAEFAAYIKSETEKWAAIVKSTGASVEQ